MCAMSTCATALALLLVPVQTAQAHFETATFEALAHGATAFQLSRVEFLLSGDLSVQDGEELFGPGATYGSDGSARWVGTPLTSSVGELGSLATAYGTNGFHIQWARVWTSGDGGGTAAPGDVTFTGVSHDGSTLTHTFSVTPNGPTDTDYALLYFPGAWTTFVLREVQITLGPGLNYIALDDLGYSTDALSPCTSRPCGSHGSCYDDSLGGYECRCQNGYVGDQCETNFDDCSLDPCQNGSACTDRTDDFRCACLAGFEGKRCDTNIDECALNPCLNGGSCLDEIARYACSCTPGFTGNSCETNIDDCSPEPCLNDGSCTDSINGYTCQCAEGFKGPHCACEVKSEGPECNCSDADGDGCLECPAGSDSKTDGPDFDGDGMCDTGDSDADNDNRLNLYDWSPLDPTQCSDVDQDGCDDCISLNFDPRHDGLDTDHDGTCDFYDPVAPASAEYDAGPAPIDNTCGQCTETDAGNLPETGVPLPLTRDAGTAPATTSDMDAGDAHIDMIMDSTIPQYTSPEAMTDAVTVRMDASISHAQQFDVMRTQPPQRDGCSAATGPVNFGGGIAALFVCINFTFRRRSKKPWGQGYR